ncbi:hypothetical protein QCE47_26260 [Caballeronia sp. LZ025]|uniref:hypothetical protein n=1 Tax=Caballeronia TaxID=1827195 RepID=UPI001FD0F135|nr:MULTISPECIES: hypothetical protein [Caballeronia]MDR5735828.1 hypothetical protein [Caballeronia sp. LZ025]
MTSVAGRGAALRGTFTRLDERYRLRCAREHEWKTSGLSIREGKWCIKCHRQVRSLSDGLEQLQAAASAKGGRCHADNRCQSLLSRVIGCPYCAGLQITTRAKKRRRYDMQDKRPVYSGDVSFDRARMPLSKQQLRNAAMLLRLADAASGRGMTLLPTQWMTIRSSIDSNVLVAINSNAALPS